MKEEIIAIMSNIKPSEPVFKIQVGYYGDNKELAFAKVNSPMYNYTTDELKDHMIQLVITNFMETFDNKLHKFVPDEVGTMINVSDKIRQYIIAFLKESLEDNKKTGAKKLYKFYHMNAMHGRNKELDNALYNLYKYLINNEKEIVNNIISVHRNNALGILELLKKKYESKIS